MTKRQRKNRKRINRLVELWPELFNREKPQPLKVEIPDDLIQDIAIRELAFGAGTLHAAVALCAVSALLMCVNGRWRPLRSEGAAVRGSDTTGTERGRGPANGAE